MKFLFLILFSSTLMAQTAENLSELDQRLQGYISSFNLKTLVKPTPSKPGLYQLGRELYFATALSGNKNISCAACHHPMAMTNDGLPLSLGEGAVGVQSPSSLREQAKGHIIARNSPSLLNLTTEMNIMFWDGRVSMDPETKIFTTPSPLSPEVAKTLSSALAAQAIFPIVDHLEMRGQKGSNPIADANTDQEAWDLIVERLLSIPSFKDSFEKVFPAEKINIGHVGEALAEFQRLQFHFSDTAYDSYLKGEITAMTETQKRGMDVFFGKGNCGACHNGAHLSSFEFHSVGVPQIGPGKENGNDYGRYQWDPKPENLYAFRVPPLRNVSLSAPYMHDGVLKTLAEVVEHYDLVSESLRNFFLVNDWKNYVEKISDHDHSTDEERLASLSPNLQPDLGFKEEEEEALIEFLEGALTDRRLMGKKN